MAVIRHSKNTSGYLNITWNLLQWTEGQQGQPPHRPSVSKEGSENSYFTFHVEDDDDLPPGGVHSVVHEHGHGHGTNPTWNRSDVAGNLSNLEVSDSQQ